MPLKSLERIRQPRAIPLKLAVSHTSISMETLQNGYFLIQQMLSFRLLKRYSLSNGLPSIEYAFAAPAPPALPRFILKELASSCSPMLMETISAQELYSGAKP